QDVDLPRVGVQGSFSRPVLGDGALVEPRLERDAVERSGRARLVRRNSEGVPPGDALHRVGQVAIDLAEVLRSAPGEHLIVARQGAPKRIVAYPRRMATRLSPAHKRTAGCLRTR